LNTLDNKTILKNTETNENNGISPRKAWDAPHQTVIKALELADLASEYDKTLLRSSVDSSSSSTSLPSNSNKAKVRKGLTFVINRKNASSSTISNASSSSASNLLSEKAPSIIDRLDSFETTVKKIAHIFTLEKLATINSTKNIALGVTLGQFDIKNSNVRLYTTIEIS
jgi:hypothetical protein